MPILLEHVSKKYGELGVFEDFSAHFPDGAAVCIMGSSGKGKTTLLYLLTGLLKPDEGKIDTGERELSFLTVFQENRLCEEFDAFTNIKMVLGNKMLKEQICRELKEVGIKEPIGKPVAQFSGGMKRRVAILRAVLAEGDVLLMDEPFKGLDQELKLHVMEYVKKHRNGRTLLIVTHDKSEAFFFGAEILELT